MLEVGDEDWGVGLTCKSSLPDDKEQTCVKNKKKKEPSPLDERTCARTEEIVLICMR